ncbi:MAG: PTS fructose transporter subunit IIA [Ottowia sp.]|nr:PTS fructose transporter subunit IIA [Ottowia sp.]
MNAILLIAHAPFASALCQAALHVLPDAGKALATVDVHAQDTPEAVYDSICAALDALQPKHEGGGVLMLTDLPGATPCNVAQRVLAEGGRALYLLTGVNLPMVLRAFSYRGEPLDSMAGRALEGGYMTMLAFGPDDRQ